MIKNKSRVFMLISVLLLSLTYLFPLWKIDLTAPQYPEGIGLRIWLNKITGLNEFDLDNINKLNHYIGMKTIEPDSIPELKKMPYIILFFILFGIITLLINKKFFTASWLISLLIIVAIGLYDFYLWEYDYGHNLNPSAPIKVPGMYYQPPLIGTKQLLNMRTTSQPDLGSYLIGLVILISSFNFIEFKKIPRKLFFLALIFLVISCQKQPEAINYQNEDCANCQMTISDNRFGSELITTKGKIFKFDSIECLVSYMHNIKSNEIHSMWVTDFVNPSNLINIKRAYFLKSDRIQSPMGLNICAFSDTSSLNKIMKESGGNLLIWEELIEYVKNEWN